MKRIMTLSLITIMMGMLAGCSCTKTTDDTRDYAYEAYCDSIWENDPTFYDDVLVETDEYQDYIEQNGAWF